MNIKRPRRVHEEDEDELMEFQEQFLRDSQQPSVKLVRKTPESTTINPISEVVEKKVKFQINESKGEAIQGSACVLADFITEKVPNLDKISNFNAFVPIIEKLNKKEIEEFDRQKVKKKSLFAQKLEKEGKLKSYHELNLKNNDEIKRESVAFIKSRIITGEGLSGPQDVDRIHQENIEKLSKMSESEIISEREKLLDTLDPKIISFIRKRNANNNVAETSSSAVPINMKSRKETKTIDDELPFKVDKKWLNMDKIEYEKLEWMKQDKKVDNGENSIKARFDFHGKLINPEDNVKIPTQLALHHHGNEPEQAGYTIDELYQLIRSQFNQQRFISIQCLANIIENCHSGEYKFKLKDPMLLDQLIESGLIFLLRFSLDNQIESIVQVTLKAFKNLLQPSKQEEVLDKIFNSFHNSYQCSALNPYTKLESSEIKELNDLEYIKLDTIKALFRMNFIERLAYLIEYFKLNTQTSIEFIFDILIRICRHSTESCYILHEKHQNIIKSIIKNFIPLTWNLSQNQHQESSQNMMEYSEEKEFVNNSISIYNKPYTGAIKFIRLLCQSSRSISICLYKNYDLKAIIIRYLMLNDNIYNEIKIEVINLLKVLTIFEITNDCLTDAYEVILKDFTSLISTSSSSKQMEAYLSLFNSLLIKLNKPSYIFNKQLCLNVFNLVLNFIKTSNLKSSKIENLKNLANCLTYLTHYLQLTNTSVDENFKKLDLCNSLFKDEFLNLNNFMSNELELSKFTKYLSDSSLILNQDSVDLIKPNNLSYLPTYLIPTAINDSYIYTFSFFVSLLRLLVQTYQFKSDNLDEKLKSCKKFLTNPYVKSYLKNAFFAQKSMKTSIDDEKCYLTKFEYYFAYYCVKLALNFYVYQDISTISQEDAYFYHVISLNLVKSFKNGDEYYIHDLLANSIFNLNLWSHLNGDENNENKNNLVKKFQNLNLIQENIKHQKSLITASGNKIMPLNTELDVRNSEQNLYQNLNFLKLNYLNNLFNSNESIKFNLERSCLLNNVFKFDSQSYETLFTSRYKEVFLFNTDWIFIPIMKIIQESQKLKREESKSSGLIKNDNLNSEKNCEIILDTLKFIYLCEFNRSDYMKQIPITIRLVNLMNIYITETSIYLDKNISFYLYILLINYVNSKDIEKLTFNMKIPGLISFYDYYQNLLKNFDSESFGDSLFAHYVLIPIQQYCPLNLRYLLWSEYLHVFKFIRFDLSLEFILPFDNYLQPNETDFNLIQLYAQALLNDESFNVIKNSQFAYIIAIKHVNAYLYDHLLLMNNDYEINFKKYLFKQFSNSQNEVLKKDALFFKNISNHCQTMLYDNLPELRRNWLQKMME